MNGMTQSQIDTINSVRKEFDAMPEPARSGAYRSFLWAAIVKWPDVNWSNEAKAWGVKL